MLYLRSPRPRRHHPPAGNSTSVGKNMNRSSIHLPEEVIEVILSKCPVKSLFRFKSVSKSWHSLISDPRFSRILKNKFLMWERPWLASNGTFLPARGGLNLVSLEEDGKFRRESVSGIPSQEFHYMYPSNGLILLQEEYGVNSFILWNPLIGKHIVIPPFNPVTHPQAFRQNYLIDPNNPNRFTVYMIDFYYDSATDDYKILIAYHHRYAVYSCKSEIWDVKDFPDNICFSYFDYCCFDGCFYLNWVNEIRYFDTRDGEEKKLMPPNDVKTLKGVHLFEISGRLCMYELSKDGRRLQPWVLEKNGSFENRWRKLIRMEKEERDLYNLYPMCLSNEGFVFIRCEVRGEENDGKLKYFIYNPLKKSFHEYEFDWRLGIHYYSYSETLYMPSSNV